MEDLITLIEALVKSASDRGYYSHKEVEELGQYGEQTDRAKDRMRVGWSKVRETLKAIETESAGMVARIEEARYVMTEGAMSIVPVEMVKKWLAYIEDGVPDGGGVAFEDGWLFEGGTIKLKPKCH